MAKKIYELTDTLDALNTATAQSPTSQSATSKDLTWQTATVQTATVHTATSQTPTSQSSTSQNPKQLEQDSKVKDSQIVASVAQAGSFDTTTRCAEPSCDCPVKPSAAELALINNAYRRQVQRKLTAKLVSLGIVALLLCAIQIMWGFPELFGYIFNLRLKKLTAIVLVGAAIATASMIFQALVNNRIITPAVMGLDSLFVLVQTTIIFTVGAQKFSDMDPVFHFFSSIFLMIGFAVLLFKVMFRRDTNNIYFILLQGIVFGTLFGSLTSFMATLIDPGEYFIVMDIGFASFTKIKTNILLYTGITYLAIFAFIYTLVNKINVMALGKEQAINLGVNYNRTALLLMSIVAVLTSISTAMVGPMTFLGLIVMNVTMQVMRTHDFKFLIPACVFISVITLIGAQLLVEKLFGFNTTISIIINFVGGIYFVYLLLREQKKW